jgi:LPXTG-motif cell wall-anchored protein
MLYAIKEIKAPEGYNLLEKPVMMAIGSVFSENSGKVFIEDATATRADENADYSFNPNVDESKAATTTVGIANSSGIKLPGTGGIGTTLFYIAGAVLVAGAGILLITKKRMGAEEE